jgi:hypothetical protein
VNQSKPLNTIPQTELALLNEVNVLIIAEFLCIHAHFRTKRGNPTTTSCVGYGTVWTLKKNFLLAVPSHPVFLASNRWKGPEAWIQSPSICLCLLSKKVSIRLQEPWFLVGVCTPYSYSRHHVHFTNGQGYSIHESFSRLVTQPR